LKQAALPKQAHTSLERLLTEMGVAEPDQTAIEAAKRDLRAALAKIRSKGGTVAIDVDQIR
jgi:hypothetical protein